MTQAARGVRSIFEHTAVAVGLTALLVAAGAPTAQARPGAEKAPFLPSAARVTSVELDRFGAQALVVRERTPGKKLVKFQADPAAIDVAAALVFEVHSEADHDDEVLRWRCVAERDVAECLGDPVRIRYRAQDERMVLSVRVVRADHIPDASAFASK